MSRKAPGPEEPTLDAVEHGLARGDDAAAIAALLPLLDARADGDPVCALAARALRRSGGSSGFAPDAMAAALDRLVQLVREQDAQIRALQAMVETAL